MLRMCISEKVTYDNGSGIGLKKINAETLNACHGSDQD